jgi:hypothetical protein
LLLLLYLYLLLLLLVLKLLLDPAKRIYREWDALISHERRRRRL